MLDDLLVAVLWLVLRLSRLPPVPDDERLGHQAFLVVRLCPLTLLERRAFGVRRSSPQPRLDDGCLIVL